MNTNTRTEHLSLLHKERVILTSLILQLYRSIDKHEAGIPTFPAEDEPVAELTTRIVLAAALQYLQYLRLGTIVSANAREYSLHGLVIACRHFVSLPPFECKRSASGSPSSSPSSSSSGSDSGRSSSSKPDSVKASEYQTLSASVEAVIAGLEYGITPIEPIITYRKTRGAITAFFGPPPPHHRHHSLLIPCELMSFFPHVRLD